MSVPKDLFKQNDLVFGFTASLVSIMNGEARAVFVLDSLPKKNLEILSRNCQNDSIPVFDFSSSPNDIEKRLRVSGAEVVAIV
jgi:ribosomal protein L30E